MWGFLCDGYHIQFFRLDCHMHLIEYPSEYLWDGNAHGAIILVCEIFIIVELITLFKVHLLQTPLANLGATDADTFTFGDSLLEIKSVLGEGRSSHVFLAEMNQSEYVAKVFKVLHYSSILNCVKNECHSL